MHRPWSLRGVLALAIGFIMLGCSTRSLDAPAVSPTSFPTDAEEAPAGEGYGYSVELDSKASNQKALASPPTRYRVVDGAVGAPAPAPPPSPIAPVDPTPSPEPTHSGQGPLLIYDAQLTLAVFETHQVIAKIEALTREHKGYLVQRTDQYIRVRVPADAFGSTLETIAGLGDELHRNVNVRDVTEEFADLEARLRALRAVRERLEALLAKAESTEDALAVERELQRVTGEIESMLGRLKLLSELVAFSTIIVNFEPRRVDKVGREHRLPFPWLGHLGLSNLLTLD